MKYLVIFLILIGFTGTVFALEPKHADYFSNPNFEIYNINEQRHTFFIPYSIANSKINNITMDCPSRAMVIDIDPAKENGTLIIAIPRTLLDSRYGLNDDSFFILVDGQEIEYSEIEKNTEARVLKIPFFENSSQIEIIVATLISQSNDPLKFAPCGKAGPEESSFYQVLSPLKQFKSGIPIDEIQCKDGLVLVQKYEDSPACVKLESIPILFERGWTRSDKHLVNLGPTDTDLIQEKIITLNKAIDDLDSGTSFNPIHTKSILGVDNKITWFNAKQEPADIQSDENYFNVTIAPREKFSFTYDAIGIYKYHDPINWKRGTILVSTPDIESSNLHPVKLLEKNHHEIAKIIATSLIPNDKIVNTRLDNTIMSAYVTDEDADIMIPKSLGILNDLENFDEIRYSYGMTKGLVFPKDEQEGLDFAKGFLEKIGYTLDGTEWIDKVNFGNRIEVTIQQKIQGWIIPNHIIRFEFTKDNTEIVLGRWYNDASQYEFKISQDDAKKISQEYMDVEVKSRPSLEKYDYTFESIQDGVRVIIFDDKPFYMVPITYKANADMNYEVGHCGSNQFLTVYVMVEGKTGTPMGWNYPGCE